MRQALWRSDIHVIASVILRCYAAVAAAAAAAAVMPPRYFAAISLRFSLPAAAATIFRIRVNHRDH